MPVGEKQASRDGVHSYRRLQMEIEVKESKATMGEAGRLAQVINDWRDCGQEGERGPATSSEELSDIVNAWRDCGDAKSQS